MYMMIDLVVALSHYFIAIHLLLLHFYLSWKEILLFELEKGNCKDLEADSI